MRTVIIGHRGTGKTSFLSRLRTYYREAARPVVCLDLDGEIERREAATIERIFREQGEPGFREIEARVFRELMEELKLAEAPVFLALGAGFPSATIPASWTALWLRRATDRAGRIFLNRPRLEPGADPLLEFTNRFRTREPEFAARADKVLEVQEGLEAPDPVERDLVLGLAAPMGAAITILPRQLRRPANFEAWLRERVQGGIRWLELRDDLLSAAQLEMVLCRAPRDRLLLSFRDPAKRRSSRALAERRELAFDWPLEWGAGTQAKAAIELHDLSELRQADQWQRGDPAGRILLPRSGNGRWAWYRLLRGSEFTLNFLREGDGSSPDQPTIMEWARARSAQARGPAARFAAVLGDPVAHSRTPVEHYSFFRERCAPVLAIPLPERELSREAMEFLAELGLCWAAVTAPLKGRLASLCDLRDASPGSNRAVNTITRNEATGGWLGGNTDIAGLKAFAASAPISAPMAVWGGGGTLPAIEANFAGAKLFSARAGGSRDPLRAPENFLPRTVLWAAGPARAGQATPPSRWAPGLVLDLSYAENSAGRAYAQSCGATYRDGLPMFRAQAAAQREIWQNGELP